MQFITIHEFNHKENESFVHFCQWTGNEEALGGLCKFIDRALYDDMYGDYCRFETSRELLSEATVDEMTKVKFGGYASMFQKHVGVFIYSAQGDEDADPYEIPRTLDQFYGRCQLGDAFKKPPPPKLPTEAELMAWAKNAAAKITHITEMSVCAGCEKVMTNEIPVGKLHYEVTCKGCGHKQTNSRW